MLILNICTIYVMMQLYLLFIQYICIDAYRCVDLCSFDAHMHTPVVQPVCVVGDMVTRRLHTRKNTVSQPGRSSFYRIQMGRDGLRNSVGGWWFTRRCGR